MEPTSSSSAAIPFSKTPFGIFIRKYWILLVVIALIMIGAFAYNLGYRLGPGTTISRVGTISVELPTNASIYADQQLLAKSSATSTRSFELSAGTHLIIISAIGDYPWSKLVPVTSGKETKILPLLVHTSTHATALTGDAKTRALTAIASSTLPTRSAPLVLENGCGSVYVENNQVIEDAATSSPNCTPPPYLCDGNSCTSTIVFAPKAPLQTVLAYPGRQDALVVGVGTYLYALALNPESPQFFAPIMEGAQPPRAATLSDGTFVVREENVIFSLSL